MHVSKYEMQGSMQARGIVMRNRKTSVVGKAVLVEMGERQA